MINIIRSFACTGIRRALSDPAISVADECICQADKCPEALAAQSKKHHGTWWIDRGLIMLALILFIMTVTAQICIYIKYL